MCGSYTLGTGLYFTVQLYIPYRTHILSASTMDVLNIDFHDSTQIIVYKCDR